MVWSTSTITIFMARPDQRHFGDTNTNLFDARSLYTSGKSHLEKPPELFEMNKPDLIRYPAIDPRQYQDQVSDSIIEPDAFLVVSGRGNRFQRIEGPCGSSCNS